MKHDFIKTTYMGVERNACLVCGKTEEAHQEVENAPIDLIIQINVKTFLDKYYKNHQLYDMFYNLLVQYERDRHKEDRYESTRART